jgi:ppGpp synthetase/RelA/SpoT-type nucleotidyltranferase
MTDRPKLDPERHKQQIKDYTAVFPHYVTYAKTLKRVLEEACKTSFPEAFIQSRAKAASSFAEKVARKFNKYPDAVNQMTDLCGARVIVQTTEQVNGVRQFIEANFKIVEEEDKALLLSEREFGYRDMHYIVQLRPDRDKVLGVTKQERAQILDRKAEIQVRTWVQHAWADTLHDRIYKNRLNISSEARRAANLLAALMEEGDRNFNRLADELDGLIANYTAVASKKEVEEEIEIQELILKNESDLGKRAALAIRLARLIAASGDYARVVKLLDDHSGITGPRRCELLIELGCALCSLSRNSPTSARYRHGRKYLDEALNLSEQTDVLCVPHLRKRESLHARALSRLGWALEPIFIEDEKAREYYHRAHEQEPGNPYYLADMLGLEMSCGNRTGLQANMRAVIREAANTCIKHAAAGIELPNAYFTGGRLSLLLGEIDDALGCYARGIRYCLEGVHCIRANRLAEEMEWIIKTYRGDKIPQHYQYAMDILAFGREIEGSLKRAVVESPLNPPVLIIAGGAASMDASTLERIRPLLLLGLADFSGTVIGGGTNIGIPGCVGDVALELASRKIKRFKLVGYVPTRLPHGVSLHKGYDDSIPIGERFLPDQILQNWRDILNAGVKPQDVLLLGFGGGPISSVEYRIALGLGASVGIVGDLKGSAEKLLQDPLWSASANLIPMPFDPTTVRAFVIPGRHAFDESTQEAMAQGFHEEYVANSTSRFPENMRPWPKLAETFKKANIGQAKYSIEILRACGFDVKEAKGRPVIFKGFGDGEVECMAEMEHGRWNIERLRDGWRYGKERDDKAKIHDCLIPWSELPDDIKVYDRKSVRAFPAILAQAGLEVFRR